MLVFGQIATVKSGKAGEKYFGGRVSELIATNDASGRGFGQWWVWMLAVLLLGWC